MQPFRRLILGRRLASDETQHTKVSNFVGLSVFSSDALSSVAYATQEIMASLSSNLHGVAGVSLAAAAAALYGMSIPVALGIAGLLVILGIGYRQTVMAYPGGGGAYIVAKENLGELAAQTAGAALLTDYILTVAASVSSGVAAITSALPSLGEHNVLITILAICFIAVLNLRGVKESGAFFAVPTYGFVFLIMVMLATGVVRAVLMGGPTPVMVHDSVRHATHLGSFAMVWIFMRAFSAGCTALTGVEAISNGVTAFREPAARNAAKTMVWMIALLGVMFLGITFLASKLGVVYMHSADASQVAETLLSKLSKAIYGDVTHGLPKLMYYLTQGFTFAVLVVAANTAYADFPRLAALHATDGFLPKQLTSQGDRLVFSNGILILTFVSCLLVWVCHANTDLLLPLYALGVFIGFTVSQTGMVMHWVNRKATEPNWLFKAILNGIGATAAGIVMIDIGVTKFVHGAWIIVVLVPTLVIIFFRIHRHYIRIRSLLASSRTEEVYPRKNRVVVLVSRIHRGTLEAIRYAKAIADRGQVEALTIDFPDAHGHPSAEWERLNADWHRYCEGIPLRVVMSEFRKTVEPILAEVDRMAKAEPEITITVILPEFVTDNWWGHLLHNQTALRLKAYLYTRPKVVVISIPYHLDPHVI
ncbi:APC family permease [Mesoterricola silvestris]|uniref:Amino acid permease n=1 Tax=Mesoterricola silvestris TaxID=2927979 RepID=A0AA48GN11_9BACT|nr:APC family permease [Mesoterricola silvestris]BDU72869.1 amino acid permease [Mesoterricola silvestris]